MRPSRGATRIFRSVFFTHRKNLYYIRLFNYSLMCFLNNLFVLYRQPFSPRVLSYIGFNKNIFSNINHRPYLHYAQLYRELPTFAPFLPAGFPQKNKPLNLCVLSGSISYSLTSASYSRQPATDRLFAIWLFYYIISLLYFLLFWLFYFLII